MAKDPYGVMMAEAELSCATPKITMATNDMPDSYLKVTVKCDMKSSLAHQEAYTRLIEREGDEKNTLLDDYWARARRIAATYAKFCLEEEKGCHKELQGRFYWMGLGAFASKTVACMFDTYQLKLTTLTHGAGKYGLRAGYEGLAKGNFWLFQDIASWHFLYNNSVNLVQDENKTKGYDAFVRCRDEKNADILCDIPKANLTKKFPWAKEALGKIGNLAVRKELAKGMQLSHDIEKMILSKKNPEDIQAIQFEHLLQIAIHEQKNILQPLIYEDEEFVRALKIMRRMELVQEIPSFPTGNILIKEATRMPTVKLTFTANCDESQEDIDKLNKIREEEAQLKALAKARDNIRIDILKEKGVDYDKEKLQKEINARMKAQGIYEKHGFPKIPEASIKDIVSKPKEENYIVLENYDTRMKWIKKTAKQYHKLWQIAPKYMKSELATMATWFDTEDRFYDTITDKY